MLHFRVAGRRFAFKSVAVALLLSTSLTTRAQQAQGPQSITTTVTPTSNGAEAISIEGDAGAGYHPSRVLVRFRDGVRNFLPGSGRAAAFPIDPDLFLVQNPPGLSVSEVVERYHANPNVVYAEPDYEVQIVAAVNPTDPRWADQWDMTKISAPTAWSTQTNASDMVVAIIDTGVDYTHPDLQGNIWSDPSNSSVHGYTCIGGSCTTGGKDDNGHGTHVAGTIGAGANNGIGIAGINWNVRLISFKFLNATGNGNISDAVLVFNKIVALKNQGVNIRVTNNSWASSSFSQALKDAITAAGNAGIVSVCAAGNNSQNTDSFPLYPAAYDNRSIISVLASSSTDTAASFTNYSLNSVDIAAPGVNTLSTVPTAACKYCDASGYKLLSGTSMASPHVAGVIAALMHLNPNLTAAEARDVILDPASYDALSDSTARTSTTGGRLNFARAIANPRLFAPQPLNNFPTLTGSDVFANSSSLVSLKSTATDADSGDAAGLRMSSSRSADAGSTWLFGWMLSSLFPSPSSNNTFTAPSVARTTTVPYDITVADNRGGGAYGRKYVTVLPASNAGGPPAGSLTVSPLDAPTGSTINVSFPLSDPNGVNPAWDLWRAGKGWTAGSCCFTGSSTSVVINTAGVYRFSVTAIDRELNLAQRQTAVVRIGGASGEPPVADVVLDKVSGAVPLTVNVNMSGSYDPDGTVKYYYINCNGSGTGPSSTNPFGNCTYNNPGTYWISMQVQDNSGQNDIINTYVVATPAGGGGGGGGTAPPSISIALSPSNPTRKSTATITASATASSPLTITKIEFYIDGTLASSDTSSPYSYSWKVPATPGKTYTLSAKAYDSAGQTTTSNSLVVSPQ